MCGIAGCTIQNWDPSQVAEQAEAFIASLHHRGPDGHGEWHEPDAVLLTHNRLAIVDLSEHGHQPMSSPAGRFVISFNGEIYNFRELRSNLEAAGVKFHGHSDTEVIVAELEQTGIEGTLLKLEGMFALAVYDRETRTLTLARDRMGEKPLYYGWLEEHFVFASELKALRTARSKFTINSSVIGDYLSYGYIPTPYSIYEGIYKLVPGTTLTIDVTRPCRLKDGFNPNAGSPQGPSAYWDVQKFSNQEKIQSSDDAIVELEQELGETIRKQLIADVPVGCFLSGGVDSTLVTALAQQQSRQPVETYTIGFKDSQFDEAKYAKEIAKYLGTDHHEFYVDPGDALALLDKLPAIYDEPFADPSQLPATLVSRIARQNVTVCLSGDGGDELFSGYNRYISAANLATRLSRFPPSFRRGVGSLLLKTNTSHIERLFSKLQSIAPSKLKQAYVGLKVHKLGHLLSMDTDAEIYGFLLQLNGLHPDPALAPHLVEERVHAIFRQVDDFIDAATLTDQLNYLVDDNLAKVDRASMYSSLETRLPLLDKRIVELSWRMPAGVKIKNGVTKWPLRELLYRHVPKSMIDRPKMGFSVPISSWIRNELKPWSWDLLTNPKLGELVDLDHYQSLWRVHQNGSKDYGLVLWPVLVLSQWLNQYG